MWDCEIAESVAKSSGSKERKDVKDKGTRAKIAVSSPKTEDVTLSIDPTSNNQEGGTENTKADSPDTEVSSVHASTSKINQGPSADTNNTEAASPNSEGSSVHDSTSKNDQASSADMNKTNAEVSSVQDSNSRINHGPSVDTNPQPNQRVTSNDGSEDHNHQTNQQPHTRDESPLASQSEIQSPRTTCAQKVSQVNQTDNIKELARGTRKSKRVTSQTSDRVST
ncbi:uncharacterized protein MELLADRAFT_108605 [Melampsora larici-populina 98AG31]|uniref:Uncharacterized protein n=1 Tax=Melampsora larici-populina (strain 98AG31 / pathotype 3-4-7) TaxID=747676 RepID=F4RTN0_MELLP|nr:uncharacterized protein MELLADRAFT_108605 [Melampsora larici-populina 98AG31]EGG04286.1 hypothetical protein MELLADRAFT_108605 [Melampsora larici-populina 98AG31]